MKRYRADGRMTPTGALEAIAREIRWQARHALTDLAGVIARVESEALTWSTRDRAWDEILAGRTKVRGLERLVEIARPEFERLAAELEAVGAAIQRAIDDHLDRIRNRPAATAVAPAAGAIPGA